MLGHQDVRAARDVLRTAAAYRSTGVIVPLADGAQASVGCRIVVHIEGHQRHALVARLLSDRVEGFRVDDVQRDPIVAVAQGLAYHLGLGLDVHSRRPGKHALDAHPLGRVLHALPDRLEEVLLQARGDKNELQLFLGGARGVRARHRRRKQAREQAPGTEHGADLSAARPASCLTLT